jgi:hypothetical protein
MIARLTIDLRCPHVTFVSWPGGRCHAMGVMARKVAWWRKVRAPWKRRWRLTAAGGDPRESATENKPPPTAQVAGGKGETGR